MIRSPNLSTLMQNLGKWLAAVAAMSMMLVARPVTSYGSESAIVVGKGNNAPQSGGGGGDFDTNECRRLRNEVGALTAPGYGQQCYDTVKAYLEKCNAMYEIVGSFTTADAANARRSNNPNRYVEYREWLKSVLYLRTDSLWYCADVHSIFGTCGYFPGHAGYWNAQIAVARYINEHSLCPSNSAEWQRLEQGAALGRDQMWRDTVKDSLTEARPDTTIPSLDSLGLSILRGPQYAGADGPPKYGESQLLNLRASENPFDRSVDIIFNLADYGLVEFKLFDALGHLVTSNGIGQVLDPGEHSFTVDGTTLPSGTYFARLAYHNGEVKTVAIVKN